ncbi:unnamed protein product [Calypogeia fissa]
MSLIRSGVRRIRTRCGICVGVTLIGIGIGLPASGFTCLPWSAMIWTGKGASNATSNFILPILVYIAQQSWEAIPYQANAFGIQNLYRTRVPKSRQFILESRSSSFWIVFAEIQY